MEWLRALAGNELALVAPAPAVGLDSSPLRELEIAVTTYPAGRGRMVAGAVRAAVGGRPIQEGLSDHGAARDALRRAIETAVPDVVVIQMVRCWWAFEVVAESAPGVPVVFDAIDSMGLHFARTAPGLPSGARRAARWEAARCRRLERRMAAAAAVTTAVARRDLAAIEAPSGRGRVVPVSAAARPSAVRAGAPTVLLSGNLGYRPTVGGALWFAQRVWPGIRERVPGARWLLVGARPSRALRRLGALPGVEVHAEVPAIAPYLAQAWTGIAPMSAGSGVPMKVLEAWAAGVPVIAHPWCADGLEALPGRDLLVASDAESWINAVTGLLGDPERARAFAAAGRAAWERFYTPDRVAGAIRAAVTAATA